MRRNVSSASLTLVTVDQIKEKFPLHWMVWNNDHQDLQDALQTEKFNAEALDTRGRTPLMLAVRLSHMESVKALLAAKCNANAECDGWTVVQEAVCSGDPQILTTILEVRDLQRHIQRVTHVPQLLQKLVDAPDFYVEMKWEFTSWVPLMSRMCPSDVYKVYKRGSNVRIDTTLLGFDHTTWQRGNRSYIFKGHPDYATMIEIDHDSQEVSIEQLKGVIGDISGIPPAAEAVTGRLNAPVTISNIDMDKISFERNKSGIWGWRSEKTEQVNEYECKVYGASNVEFITRTRTEHLSEQQAATKNSRTPLQSFLGFAEEETAASSNELQLPSNRRGSTASLEDVKINEYTTTHTSQVEGCHLTPEEYFSEIDLQDRDIGRPKKTTTKVQRFKANLWLSEQFPIKLQEQVLPILDLMSTMASPHVSKLKDFITMQLPSGFPVKIEIPLFHVLNACVTFGNVFGLEEPVQHVTSLQEDERLSCVIDDCCFDVPAHYARKGADYRRQLTFEDEDDLVQFAIEQSLMETGSETDKVDIWEALRAQRPITPGGMSDEDSMLQRVLQESMFSCQRQSIQSPLGERQLPDGFAEETSDNFGMDPDLAEALRLSAEEEKRIREEMDREDEMLLQALRLSLEEK